MFYKFYAVLYGKCESCVAERVSNVANENEKLNLKCLKMSFCIAYKWQHMTSSYCALASADLWFSELT